MAELFLLARAAAIRYPATTGSKMRVPILRGLMIAMLTLVVSNGVAFAGPLEDGIAAYDRGDYATALQLIMPLAAKGNAAAQFNIGLMYQQEHGVPKDYNEAIRWYRLAAAQGYGRAQTNLGWMYANGRGVRQDYYEAAKLYRLAAEQGDVHAQGNLGAMYESGHGVPQDYDEAVKWYRQAAAQGSAPAQSNLGEMYQNGWVFRKTTTKQLSGFVWRLTRETHRRRAISE